MRNKKIIISVGTLSLLLSSPLLAISCSGDKATQDTIVTISGENLLVADLRNDSVTDLLALQTKVASWRNTAGKHFAVQIKSKVTSSVETYVYAVKTVAQGYTEGATWEVNSVALTGTESNVYKGYRHMIDGAQWKLSNDYFALEREWNNSLELDENNERIIKFERTEIKTANLATLTQPQALSFLQGIDVDKSSIGKHTAYRIIDGANTSTLVYAVKNEDEGFYETIGQNYLLEFDETGYEGYTHMIQGEDDTYSEWYHDMGFYTYLGRIRQIAYPQVTKAIPSEDQYTIDLPNLTEAQALAKYNEIEVLKNTKGKHIAVKINSATNVGTTGTMVYAVKNDNEGFNADASVNLLPLEGTRYKGYTHTINGTTWVNTNEVLVLIKEWRMKAGIEPTVVDKTLAGEDLMSIDLTTATAEEAKEFMIKLEARQNTPGAHTGVKIRSKATPTLTGVMVYAIKSFEQGYVYTSNHEENWLTFSGSGYAGYNHIIDGATWGHSQNYYGPLNELRGLAMQHSGATTRINISGSKHLTINMQGMLPSAAADINRKLIFEGNVPGNHFAVTLTSADGVTTATMVYAIKSVADGFAAVTDRPAATYPTVGGATGKYAEFDHFVGNATTHWTHQMAYNQLIGPFRDLAASTLKAIPTEDVHTIDLATLTTEQALAKYNEIETLKATKGKHIAVKIISETNAGTSSTMVYAVKNDEEGYNAEATSNLISMSGGRVSKYVHTIDNNVWVSSSTFTALLNEWKAKAGVTL